MEDDVGEGGRGADFVGVGLGGDHHFEIDLAACAAVVFGVDYWFVGRGGFGAVLVMGGGQVDAAFRERVLEHLHHCCVLLPRYRFEKGAVIADVEVPFDLTQVLVR